MKVLRKFISSFTQSWFPVKEKCTFHKIVENIAELDNHCYGNRQKLLH